MNRLSFRAERSGSRMERLGKPLHGREDRRLSEREVSESTSYLLIERCLEFARHDNALL
jgi:hypothetical protein